MQQNQSQNPMAVEPVPKLMARIGLPIVLSVILQRSGQRLPGPHGNRRRNRPDCLEPGFPGAVVYGGGVHRHRRGHQRPAGPPVGPGRQGPCRCRHGQCAVFGAGHLTVPPGVVCAAAGLGADPAGDRPGECLPRLVAAGPGRSRHTGSGAGAVPEAGEKTDRFLKKAAGGTTSDGFCIG